MPSNSKSNRRKKKKSKFVEKLKQPWRVKKPTRNWSELPSDLMLNIFQRIGAVDLLHNAQKVCTAWREISKDPDLWRIIYIAHPSCASGTTCKQLSKQAVDRSQGQLVDLTIIGFCDYELLQYVADRSTQLRRLEVVWFDGEMYGNWNDVLKKLTLLEELSVGFIELSEEDIEAAGRYCPLLKTLKVYHDLLLAEEGVNEETALAIAKHLPDLTHLELIGNCMHNFGLQTILDGCSHLETLDLRLCCYVDLKGDLGKRCSQQIKHLKLPRDSLKRRLHFFLLKAPAYKNSLLLFC